MTTTSAMKTHRTETSDLSSSPTSGSYYGSTSLQDKSVAQFCVPWCGLVFYVMAFFGFFSSLILREGLNVAIVAMVNQTAVANENAVVTNVSEDQCPRDPELQYESGEFNWDRNQQGIVLAAFYYGYGILQVPGGWMADRFGGKWLCGGSILLSSVVALLTPTAARIHIVVLIILRVLSGFGEGVKLPSMFALIARWSAPKYRSLVVSVICVGEDVGIIVGMFLSGVLCDYGFVGGWPSVFYVFGAFGCVWSASWFLLCYNSPSTHPRILTVEREYWETLIGTKDLVAHPPMPWREILASIPVWALAVAYFAHLWGFFTLVTCLPLFMHDVLGFGMTENGAFSAIPFVASLVVMPINGLIVDWLRSPGRLSTNVVRKIFCAAGFTLAGGFLILAGYISCNRALAVATMFAVIACERLSFASVHVNQLDMAPLHAGKIVGLTFAIGILGSIAAPHVVSVLTSRHSTRSEWQNVFFLAAGVYFVGAVIFVIFGSGDRQRWADDTSSVELSVTIDQNKQLINDKEVTGVAERHANEMSPN